MRILFLLFIFSFAAEAKEPSFPSIDMILGEVPYENRGGHSYGLSTKNINGETVLPKCRMIFNKIYRLYGGPDIVRKYVEVTTPIHRRVWKKKGIRISLMCLEYDGIRYAERIWLNET